MFAHFKGPGYGQDMANYVNREEFVQKAPIFITVSEKCFKKF